MAGGACSPRALVETRRRLSLLVDQSQSCSPDGLLHRRQIVSTMSAVGNMMTAVNND